MRNDQLSIEPTDVHARNSISHGEKLITDGDHPATLAETLHRSARIYGESRGIIYLLEDGSEVQQSYGDLWDDARRVAEGLRHSGLQPQDVLLMQLPHNEQFIPAFWGCALAGCVPSPLAVAPAYTEMDSAAQKLKDAWTTLDHPPILTNREMLPELQNWADMMGLSQIRWLVIEELLEFDKTDQWHQALPEDLAILVLTSGSTGAPKAVMLSHSNVLSMVKGMIQMFGFTDQDVTFNWMPFDHVGGIFMMHMRDVYLGCKEINITGQSVLIDPLSWLDGIDRYRASVTWAPNFAFGLVNDYAQEINSRKWDLSCMRFMFNGGEAAVAKVVRTFLTLLEPHGLPANAIRPAWGMSETSSGVIFSDRFMRSTTRDEDDFVETGLPIPGLSIRIVDDHHQLMPEGSIGRLQVKGMSITSGYYQQPELSQTAFTADGWFETGDLGFIREGRLTLTGRTKDAIIINGVNYYSYAIESAVEELPDIETSYTAACAIRTQEDTTDQLAIFFVPSRSLDEIQMTELLQAIRSHVARTVGIVPEYVLPLEHDRIPKTPIGKIQRPQLRKAFENGEFADLQESVERMSRAALRTSGRLGDGVEWTREATWKELVLCFEKELGGSRDWAETGTNLLSLGLNSIKMMRLIRLIEKSFRIKMTARELYKHPTFESLAELVFIKAAEQYAASADASETQVSSRESEEKLAAQGQLSEVQKGLWTLQKMDPESSAYHIPLGLRFAFKVDIEKLKQALKYVLEQHPILTSVIVEVDGVPCRTTQPSGPLSMTLEDISMLKESEIVTHLSETAKKPFAGEGRPLMNIFMFSRSEDEHYLLIVIHHLVFDGVSSMTLMHSLLDGYKQLEQGQIPVAQPALDTYDNYVAWEQRMLSSEEGEKYRNYWLQQLSGTLPTLQLPADRPKTSRLSRNGQTSSKLIPAELENSIKTFASHHSISMTTVLLAGYMILLNRYTGQEEMIVGMPVMTRPEERFESMIGNFLNMIPIRERVREQATFEEFLHNLQYTLLDGLDHAVYPLPRMVQDRNKLFPGGSQLFQTAFYSQNFLQSTSYKQLIHAYAPDYSIDFVDGLHQEGEYELIFELWDEDDRMTLNIKYDADTFEASTVDKLGDSYMSLMESLIRNPALALDQFSLFSEQEEHTVLHEWNDTQADYPDAGLPVLFEQQAVRTPDAIAVICDNVSLTYRELDERSTLVAIYLQAQGIVPDNTVAICVDRSLDMIVGLLGILKAGAAYVPLDPDYPEERLAYMLEDSKASVLLTQSDLRNKRRQLFENVEKVILLDQDRGEFVQKAEGRTLKQNVKPEHLAYVLYTSGSTGKPKGVMISHRALVNFLFSMSIKPGLKAEDRLLAVTTYCFDIAGLELFLPLLMGAQCCICKSDVSKDAERLKREIQTVRPTIMQATPATWSMLFQSGWKNDERVKVLCGGEALPSKLKQYFISSGTEAWNMFGPTETTIWSTVNLIQLEEPVSIGRPIANTQVYIVDKQLRPVPIGIPGELCIAGDGLARGYYNQPALTAEKFVDNPFQSGAKLYRTGDLSRWLPDGQIEYLGRIDNQVKLRGFRIELGAIETRLSGHAGVEDAVAVVKQAGEHKTLVAYYTARECKTAPQARELQSHLKTGLPDYMVPAHVIRVDRMPLTPSGKIDRKELADRPVTVQRAEIQSVPGSRVEQTVLAIWQDVLQVGGIGIRDGFFDVGGDSLLAVTVAERVRKDLACEFTAMDLFEYPTVQAISAYVAREQAVEAAQDAARDEVREDGGQEDPASGQRRELDAERAAELQEAYKDSLAIIGISCEFPGAENHFEFWNNLLTGKESLKFFTQDELRDLGVPEELAENAAYVPVQSTIAGKDRFDPGFFNVSPKDASFMDPQLRLLLLHAWKAVEDAGYVAREIPQTSVFMTGTNNGYRALLPEEWTESLGTPDGYVSWVLAQSGTIPTMISHKLGLKGPSYFVHANCSSSLVGLYSAYQSLQSGESKYALVGGATLHTGTDVGYVHQAGLNFSSDGHVKAFDASADGMIGGEGAAVLLLKKAADAVADGDHIYALLRGIGLNNDGADKVGFYAPSVKGQADVIRKVLETTGIDPESISYVEAHGTGTKLGDPIELSALSAVYREHTQRKQYCGIGSVKTNIGHLDTAAGMAGCIKVAMSLYHGELAPTINYKEPNPNMDLESSPFYVVESRKRLETKKELYRAALSSFGLGGTNTHAIFEQYRGANQESPASGPYLIPVSAKNQERLRSYAESLLNFVSEGHLTDGSLADLAYTFQVGREAMDSRVAFVAEDAAGLKSQLESYLQGQGGKRSLSLYTGERKQEGEALLEDDEDSKTLVRAWITGGRLSKLAEAWCQGLSVDWTLLYQGARPHRMSAPTYPFAQERIQIPRSNAKRVTAEAVAAVEEQRQVSYLHPLLHLNTSDLLEQRFSSTFTGKEFFLADHVVRGNPVLPGVAYLEMARTAIQLSQGRSQHERTGIRLKHIVWIQPIVSDGTPAEVHIGLFPEADGRIGYEIYSHSAVDDSEIVHGQGTAEWMEESQPLTWDIHELLRRCKDGELSSNDFYEDARGLGITFGAGFQGIQSLYAGEREVLSKLVLPAAVVKTRDSYVLHPSMLDAALQTATICIMRGGAGHKLLLPFALEELEVYGPCTSDMWAYARFSQGNKAGDPVQRVDVDLCDESGALRVKIKGFTARVLEGGVQAVADSSSKIERLLLEPIWVERPAASEQPIYEYEKHLIFLCDTAVVARDHILSHLPDAEVFCLDSGTGTPSMRFEAYAGEMFEHIKAILLSKPEGNLLIQTVVCHQGEEQIYSGLTGLLKTAGLEYSKLSGQLIEISGDAHHADIAAMLKDNAIHPADKHIRYTDGRRYVSEWRELDQKLVKDAGVPWKDRGVYFITGGAGRLGLLFAKEIGQKVSEATVILTGRGALREDQEQQVDRLRGMGLHVVYKQLDATDSDAVQRLIGDIVAEYGHLDGIIHGAGIIQDNIIIKKTRGELEDVMAPKVSGLLHLDEASRELPLDFFFVFSSISGSLGNPGQADYATANAFMDAYIGYRNELTQKSQRSGVSLSVNWPLWKDGGMQVDVETEKLMMQNLGLVPMQTHSGIQALYDAYASGKTQVFVVEGNRHKIKQKLWTAPMSKPIKEKTSGANGNHSGVKNGDQQSELQISLKQMVSDLLKVSLQDLDVDTELGEYGFDSISFTVFANQINTAYTFELAPTVFFEYGTLRTLTEFLVREYGDVLNSRQTSAQPEHVTNTEVESTTASAEIADAGVNRVSKRRSNRFTLPEQPEKAAAFEPIAIVGISGKFPGAADIDEFWTNLMDEKDCITEIPQDRWNWREYDGDPAKEINKTKVKWGGFIEGVDEFDPLFFGISPREAQFIDPQQRLLMTYAWKAIEDAGICPQSLSGTSTGVFVGTGNTGYKDLFHKADLPIEGHSTMGNMIPSVGPNRLSYFLDVHGPSEPVETACSSSLVAIHRAASAIQMGDCEMAIVGGVNTIVTPEAHISYSKAGMLSVNGRCRTFSSRADGYVRGEGVGIIVLKKLKDAERDRNPIYGVIRGTAENHGGRANTLTSPNPRAQAELLIKAYKKAGVDPRTVTYIEAHGTGTELGDPIEINGLKAAFKELYATSGDSGVENHRCGLGSVKSNIGHLELAAGISGVIKILLQMKYKTLVKSLHTETLNPYLQLKDSPFYIVQNTEDWKALQDKQGRELPRRAGVSSFGIGGVNAHIVIEEYLPKEEEPSAWSPSPRDPAIIVLSAKNEKSLREQAEQLLMSIRMRKVDENDLSRIAYTLQVGRNSMEERLALIVGSMSELVEKLEDFSQGKSSAEQSYRGKANRNNETLTLISADEDMALAIDSWIVKRKYARLAEIWVKGLHIDWNKLYGDTAPGPISLPTYPFAKERYWIPEYLQGGDNNNVSLAGDKEGPDSPPEQRTTCLLAKSWVPCPSVTKTNSHRIVAILTHSETESLAERVAEYFPQYRIIHAEQAEQFLDCDWKSFDGVVDLAGCGSSGSEMGSSFKWLQSLIEHGHKEGLMLLGVTRGLESYLNPGAINLTGAARAGLYRMLQSEYSHLRSRHMDAELTTDDRVLAQQIADEYFADSEEAEVCYRNGMRFRCILEEQNEGEEAAMKPESFPQDHVLLVTGGTRGLGALCARHFVRHYGVKRLVLTGREELPPRETWDDLLAAATPLSQKIQAVRELEAQGVQVQVLAPRLSDQSAVRRELDHIKRTLGPIGGVLHCAGLTDMTTLAFIRKTDAEIQEVLEPKIAGLNTLYDELRGEPLKFFVLFSSVSAIIPSLSSGQGDYAMANAYMDYFAEAVRHVGPIVSIQWPNWKEAGMGEVTNPVYKESGLLSISNAEGLQLLDYILQRKGSPVVLPARIDRSKWYPERLMRRSLRQAAEGSKSIRQAVVSADLDQAVTQRREDANFGLAQTETWLLGLFAEELRIDPSHLAMDEAFQEYGVDSIILAQLLQRINRKIAANLDPSILYEYPTIQQFAAWLSESYPAALNLIAEEPASERPRMKERELAKQVIPEQPLTPLNKDSEDLVPSPERSEDIAIVGLSCRFAGAETLEAYWELLSGGQSAIRSVPPERWGHPSSFYAGVLDGVSEFDPTFFLIPEEDAKAMDPQALVALEECLKLWHHAGYTLEEMKGKAVGVYLGGRSHNKPGEESLQEARNPIVAVGQNYLAANLSQFFDLRGPSLVLDTACSSAIVGMNMAVQALRSGDIESAVVGGISLLETDAVHRLFQQRGILSEAPSFHVFDERADGVVLGEGVGMVLLKTVDQALKDGDTIYAVVKAVALNNDGRTAGPATPNLQAQKDVMQAGLAKGGKRPEEISYIEANGSGSTVTDLLELKAIQSVYRSANTAPLGLGSVKPNIGHPLCAEGIASLIKVVLMLRHRQLVPFLSGEREMTHFDRKAAGLSFYHELIEWPSPAPVAAINCFADGGTNAHVIVEAWQDPEDQVVRRRPLPAPELNKRLIPRRDTESMIAKPKAQSLPEGVINIWDAYEVEV